MNKDELKGKFDQAKGRIKQGAGDLADNERLHDEGAAGQFVFDRWMCARDASACVDHLAVTGDRVGQGFGAVESLASLRQELDAAGITKRIFVLNPLPQTGAMRAERAGRGNADRFAGDERKRRFVRLRHEAPIAH